MSNRFINHYQNVQDEWLGDEVTKEEFYDLYHGNYITDPENPTTYIKVKQTHNIWSQPFLELSAPRACAYRGQNLRQTEYELGSGTFVYDIGKYNPFISPKTILALSESSEFECLDGTTDINYAIYDHNDKSVHIDTD